MIRLVLVDDQPSVRQGLRMRLTLEPDMTVVGEASNGREAMTGHSFHRKRNGSSREVYRSFCSLVYDVGKSLC